MTRSLRAAAAIAFAVFLAACAAPGGGGGEMEIRQGRVEQITMTTMKSNHDAGLGAILGGVAGAGLGSLIGAGMLADARPGVVAVLPVLDLSLTGDVDAEAATLLGIDLIDLEEIGAHAPAEQAAAVLAARDLVSRGVDTYLHLEQGRAATPAVPALRAHVSQFIEREIEAANRRYDSETAAAVARSLRRVSNALLHTPSLRAAELARSGELADYSHALQTLFGIEIEAQA